MKWLADRAAKRPCGLNHSDTHCEDSEAAPKDPLLQGATDRCCLSNNSRAPTPIPVSLSTFAGIIHYLAVVFLYPLPVLDSDFGVIPDP